MHLAKRLALCLILPLAACGERERPHALEPDVTSSLQVDIVRPTTVENTTVLAGHQLFVTVRASEPGGRLGGVGLVVQRQPYRFVDSLVVSFPASAEATHVFTVLVPDTLPSNSQLDLIGIAFGPAGATRVSERQSVIVLRCPPNATWCT